MKNKKWLVGAGVLVILGVGYLDYKCIFVNRYDAIRALKSKASSEMCGIYMNLEEANPKFFSSKVKCLSFIKPKIEFCVKKNFSNNSNRFFSRSDQDNMHNQVISCVIEKVGIYNY